MSVKELNRFIMKIRLTNAFIIGKIIHLLGHNLNMDGAGVGVNEGKHRFVTFS